MGPQHVRMVLDVDRYSSCPITPTNTRNAMINKHVFGTMCIYKYRFLDCQTYRQSYVSEFGLSSIGLPNLLHVTWAVFEHGLDYLYSFSEHEVSYCSTYDICSYDYLMFRSVSICFGKASSVREKGSGSVCTPVACFTSLYHQLVLYI